MKKTPLLLLLLFLGSVSFAHSPDISSTMLIEESPSKWLIQVRAPLTAFEQEIITKFGENPYSSPEEFQDLVLNHVQKNLSILWEEQSINFQNGQVILGHETAVILELEGQLENFKNITITNSSFQNIQNNQSALEVVKKGLPKAQFILNDANQHRLNLIYNSSKNTLVEFGTLKNAFSAKRLGLAVGVVLLIIGAAIFFLSKD